MSVLAIRREPVVALFIDGYRPSDDRLESVIARVRAREAIYEPDSLIGGDITWRSVGSNPNSRYCELLRQLINDFDDAYGEHHDGWLAGVFPLGSTPFGAVHAEETQRDANPLYYPILIVGERPGIFKMAKHLLRESDYQIKPRHAYRAWKAFSADVFVPLEEDVLRPYYYPASYLEDELKALGFQTDWLV
ncbi:MAG: hypothetical protein HY369_01600 [Candidatus Aenigmarchaeota archaeon]|nr:hypothetical protein [Candidatus Aenigmarchaeota archaeon]